MTCLLLLAPGVSADEALPPPGFLEFLGTMVETEEGWVDPLSMSTSAEEILMEETEHADGADVETAQEIETSREKARKESGNE